MRHNAGHSNAKGKIMVNLDIANALGHRSLVDYLPQVKKAKNCPTTSECVLS